MKLLSCTEITRVEIVVSDAELSEAIHAASDLGTVVLSGAGRVVFDVLGRRECEEIMAIMKIEMHMPSAVSQVVQALFFTALTMLGLWDDPTTRIH